MNNCRLDMQVKIYVEKILNHSQISSNTSESTFWQAFILSFSWVSKKSQLINNKILATLLLATIKLQKYRPRAATVLLLANHFCIRAHVVMLSTEIITATNILIPNIWHVDSENRYWKRKGTFLCCWAHTRSLPEFNSCKFNEAVNINLKKHNLKKKLQYATTDPIHQ